MIRKTARKLLGAMALSASALVLGACSHAGSIGAMSTDYNGAIHRARSEQVLLNVVRASAREPLQFTAVGEITASVNRSIGVDTVAAGLLGGGRNAFTSGVNLNLGTSPLVRIAPLSSREFTDGFLRPITPEALHLFISQGWDGEFLLPLVVGSYTCNGRRYLNVGDSEEGARIRDRLAAAGDTFQLRQVRTEGAVITMTVSSDRASEMLSQGVATGHQVLGVTPGAQPGTSEVRVRQPDGLRWVASSQGLCDGASGDRQVGFDGGGEVSIQLRSPHGIIYFLGEAFRPCFLGRQDSCDLTYNKDGRLRHLFRIRNSAGGQPAAVAVEHYGARYWIPRLDAEDTDRSLKTVAFLDQLIALQTSAQTVTPTLISLPGN
jgi:hypothetical protein